MTPRPNLHRELFTIDVFAEIRKLSTRRFKTPADATAGFVGFLSGLGPTRIDISTGSGKIVFDCSEHPRSLDWLALLVAVFDPRVDERGRHDALVRLERDFGLDALAAFSAPNARLTVTHPLAGDEELETVELNRWAWPRRRRHRRPKKAPRGWRVVIRGKLGRSKELATALEYRGRFSPVELRLDGRRISKGHRLENMLLSKRVRADGLQGVVGLPRNPGLCEVHILKNGIVTETKLKGIQRGLEFHAVVEAAGSPFAQIWSALRTAAEDLLFGLKHRIDELDESDRTRALDLLVHRSPFTRQRDLLEGARLFPQCNGRPLCLEEIRNRARFEKIYVTSDRCQRRLVPMGRTILALSSSTRELLEKHHRVPLHTAPRHTGGRISLKLRARVRRLWKRFAKDQVEQKAPDVCPKELEDLGRAVENALQSELIAPFDAQGAALRVVLSPGVAPLSVRKEGTNILVALSQDNPVVKSAARAFRDAPANFGPALVALWNGEVTLAKTRLDHLFAFSEDQLRRSSSFMPKRR